VKYRIVSGDDTIETIDDITLKSAAATPTLLI